jgi:hypothetical protein
MGKKNHVKKVASKKKLENKYLFCLLVFKKSYFLACTRWISIFKYLWVGTVEPGPILSGGVNGQHWKACMDWPFGSHNTQQTFPFGVEKNHIFYCLAKSDVVVPFPTKHTHIQTHNSWWMGLTVLYVKTSETTVFFVFTVGRYMCNLNAESFRILCSVTCQDVFGFLGRQNSFLNTFKSKVSSPLVLMHLSLFWVFDFFFWCHDKSFMLFK